MSMADRQTVQYVVEALTPEGTVLRLPAATWRAAQFLGERLRDSGSMVEMRLIATRREPPNC
jgi:hypothetical protein